MSEEEKKKQRLPIWAQVTLGLVAIGFLIAASALIILLVSPKTEARETLKVAAHGEEATRVVEVEKVAKETAIVAPTLAPAPVAVTGTTNLEEAAKEVVPTAEVANEAPALFDADSCPPEGNPKGCSLDVGVKEGQVGLAFGWHIRWPKGELDAGGDGCDLVVLRTGWYENLRLLDGRYEVYNVPSIDFEGWVEVLTTQRAGEQAEHYGCPPPKKFVDIPQWASDPVSDSTAELTEAVAEDPKLTTSSTTPEPMKRRTTGENASLYFEAKEAVYGWEIVLDSGEVCDEGECYLPVAPSGGIVTNGVINPWHNEVPEKTEVWDPNPNPTE